MIKSPIGNNKMPAFAQIYRLMALFIVPLILGFLLLEDTLNVPLDLYYKSLLIYILCMLVILVLLGRIKLFESYFEYAHYAFLSGVMIINLVWFSIHPGQQESFILLLAFNLIGVVLIHPWVTLVFLASSFLAYLGIGWQNGDLDMQYAFLIIAASIVITLFNFWRYRLYNHLKQSRISYKSIFDSSEQQIYVLSEGLEIIEVSAAAEKYMLSKGYEQYLTKGFSAVFIPETDKCAESFKEAIIACKKNGSATFQANCAIAGSDEFVPKEFNVRSGEFFGKNVYIIHVRVVGDQVAFERELLEHKDNVTQILENINYFVYNITFDVKDRFKHHVNFVSAKVKDVLDYSTDEYIALVKAERLSKDVHQEDVERVRNEFEELLKMGGKKTIRYRMKIRGKWRWIQEKITVQALAETDMVSLFGMVKDVHDEVRAESQLIESEKRYRQIFETNLAGVYKTHINGEILDCNPAFANILGYDSTEELKKQRIDDLYHQKKDRTEYLDLLHEKKQLNNYTSKIVRKDGRVLILNNNVSLITDEEGQENIIVGTVVDVTDLHETSLALQHSEEKYRLLFEESNNAILLVILKGEESYVVDANQMGAALFGYSETELIGKKLLELLDEKVDLEQDLKEIEVALNEFERDEREWEFVTKENKTFYAEVSFASVELDGDKVVHFVIKDISDRKQYEKEILESRLSFKNIVDRSPAGILIFSNNELAYVNPNGEELFMNVLNSSNRNLFKVFPEDKHQLIRDLIKEAENDINSYTEIDLGTGENAKRYSINVVNTIYNFEKADLFILQDISLQTEYNIQKLRAEMAEEANVSLQEEILRHKRTQLSLVESTSRLRALFESAANLYIISIDRNFKLVSYNNSFAEMVRAYLGKEVAVGDNFMELFPVEDWAYDIIIGRMNKVLAGEPSNLVSKFVSLTGEVWMESFMSPILIEDQEIKEISFISHDITEQIENRRKILQSEENNRALLLAVPDILFKANRQGVFTDYRATSEENREAFKIFTKTDEIKGKKIVDVLKDVEVAKQIAENVITALDTDQLVTHNFSIDFGDDKNKEKVHFENRYSKVNEDEVVIISRNVTSTVEYEQKLIESVKEKEVLLKEVHHRVKNNLQVINSILNLQSSYVKDDETLQIIIESQNRIRSMSYIHESLYQTKDFSSIDFKDYITNLVQNLIHSYEVYSEKTELDLKVEKVALALDQAIPCGLILNELITNALKYAYPGKEGGKITIEVFEKNGKVHIKVQDFGVGLPKDFNISDTDSLGLSLVDTLIDQLDGELKLKTGKGTEFLIIFEKQEI